ncbi:MAG TPA: hypothetical protein VE326_11345 [Candidatus Binatia bacterium]|nr:hypothetical protein [Candidatus Binatia bacterium]
MSPVAVSVLAGLAGGTGALLGVVVGGAVLITRRDRREGRR